MKSNLRNNDKLFLGLTTSLFVIVSVLGWFFIHELILIVDLGLVLFFSMFISLVLYRKYEERSEQQDQQNSNHYRQLEALFSVFTILQPNSPFPSMRHFSITPDFARTLIDLVMLYRPKLVVETGSGTSTLVVSYALQKLNDGKIISLENSEMFANKHQSRIVQHHLDNFSRIIYAPLKEYKINDKIWQWYDMSEIQDLSSIDMLIVDAPPQSTQSLARYPAIPLLFDKLSDNAIIVLDDFNSTEQKEIVKLWMQEFNISQVKAVQDTKGTVILCKSKT